MTAIRSRLSQVPLYDMTYCANGDDVISAHSLAYNSRSSKARMTQHWGNVTSTVGDFVGSATLDQCLNETRNNVAPTASNGGDCDTQSRNLYKRLVHVDLYKKLDRLTWFPVLNCSCIQVSCTNTAQLYSIQETCMHVTRVVSSDWSAAYCCHYFHFVVFMLLTIYCTKLI